MREPGPRTLRTLGQSIGLAWATALVLAILSGAPCSVVAAESHEQEVTHNHPEHGTLGEIGAKLADPTSNIWALQLNINGPTFFDGDLNEGDPAVGGNAIFQPVLPVPLYGVGSDQWKLVMRPVVPIVFSQPIPKGIDEFTYKGGLGDIELPLLLNPSQRLLGNWILAAGPVFEFPTSTTDSLGAQQFSMGPAVAAGYKTKNWTAILFPNYFWGIGDRGDRRSSTPTTSKLSLLYAFIYNLPKAWQVGFNPTVSYNARAAAGDRWDVPAGLFVAKTIAIGGVPVKAQAGLEYSVVSADTFGKRVNFRFVLTPVIPGLVQNAIFGGR